MNDSFVGREAERQILAESTSSVIQVVGLGGMGKTSLVRAVLSNELRDLRYLNIECYGHNGFPAGFAKDASAATTGYDLVIIDGAEVVEDSIVMNAVADVRRSGLRAIITTRKPLPIPDSEQLLLVGLSISDAFSLIALRSKTVHPTADVQELARHLEGHPLALSIVAGLLGKMTAREVIERLEGTMYELNLPPKQTATAAGIIVPTNDSIIAALKKTPHDLHSLTPRKFEEIIADLLRGLGWDTYLTPATRDGGKDILAYFNTPVGRLLCIVEAKHFRPDRPVGVQLVRNLYGVFCDQEANSSLLVTSSYFTPDAVEFQLRHRQVLELRDYTQIVQWIRNHKR